MADGGVLATDPGNDSIFWSGGKWYYMSTCVSFDQGWSWTRYNPSPYEGWTYAIAVDPTNSNNVYAGGIPCVYRTTDFGQNWTACSTGMTGYANDIKIFAPDPSILFAGTCDGVFMSNDYGNTWNNIGCTDVNVLLLNSLSTDTILAGTDNGVWITTDEMSWTPMGLDGQYVRSIHEYPDTWYYAGTYGAGVFRWMINVGEEELAPSTAPPVTMSAYPNPFSCFLTLQYYVPSLTHVRISLYDASGRHIYTLINGYQNPGHHTIQWNGQDEYGNTCAPGIYFYQMITASERTTGSIIRLQ